MINFVRDTFYRMAGGNTTIPVTLGLRNIYILPTGYGLLYLVGLTAMLIGSINYNNNLGFLLTFLLGSLGLTAMLHTYGMLYGLRLATAAGSPVFAGEPMDVEIVVAGVKRPRTQLRWYFSPDHMVVVNHLPGGPTRVRVPVITGERGWFSPPPLRIACDYPLGLFRAWSRIHADIREVVYPHPLKGPQPGIDTLAGHGEEGAFPVAGTDDFTGLNVYQPGDSPQRIHWQAYSRGRGLFVKQFGGLAGAGTMLDMERLKGENLEKKMSVLCFHVLSAHRQRLRFGLKLIGRVVPLDTGKAHRDRCLRILALFGRL